VSLNATYDADDNTRSNDGTGKKIKGEHFGLNAQYHFNNAATHCVHTFKVVLSTAA
jgi:OOP family OmpA-OmpF porin